MSSRRFVFLLLSAIFISNSGVLSQDINPMKLEDGEFKNVLVAIHDDVPEDPTIIDKIKDMFIMGSSLLFSATKFRVFWKEILILVPQSWTRDPSYKLTQSESFNRANIQIITDSESTEPIVIEPVVLNQAGCGKEGLHMTLTSGYLHDTSNCYDMDIVRQWARLRWGLMPEHYTGDSSTGQFYIEKGVKKVTRCSEAIKGEFIQPHNSGICREDPFGNYPAECIYQPECIGSTCASLMFGSHCDRMIVEFCNKNESDTYHGHNTKAPNLQNIKCGYKSAWEVLDVSADFVNEKNPPMLPGTNTIPTFMILQPPDIRRVVLVLDISSSMSSENRFNKLIQAATIFIMDLIPTGSEVGIVSFNDDAYQDASLREIRDGDSSREDLVNDLPSYTAGLTCIGCGIQEGINSLGVNSNGGYIFLLSGGQENVHPYIRDVLADVKSDGVVIDTIAISNAADEQIEDLAAMTGGIPFFCHDFRSSVKITDKEIPPRPDESIQTVSINEMEGKDTMIAVTWLDFYIMDVRVEGPNGEFIDYSDPRYNVDTAKKIITIRIPVASPGKWDITMLHNEMSTEIVGLTITTKQQQIGVETVDVHVILSSRNVDFSTDPKLGIFSLVQRGHIAVKNADVQAVMENSIGSITTKILLHDDGTGSDFMEDDGVYSGYFLNFDANGRYNVMVDVLGTTTSHTSRTNIKRRAVIPTPPYSPSSFMRSASDGIFVVNNYISNAPDILAPSRIQNLAYSSFSFEDATVTLTWTAVGDDIDQGTASEYELRYSNDFDVLRVNFSDNALVVDHQIIDGNLSLISPGGHLETLTILLPVIHYNLNYYFSIRALDEAGNAGAMSNIVSLPIIEPFVVNISTSAPNMTAMFQPFTDGTNFTTPISNETLYPDVSPSKSPLSTFDPNATEPILRTSTGWSGEPNSTEPQVNTESTLLTSTEGDEKPHPTERPSLKPLTTEEPHEPTDLALIIALTLTFTFVAFGGVVGAAFGVAMYKKKQARIRPVENPSESYLTDDDRQSHTEYPNLTYSDD